MEEADELAAQVAIIDRGRIVARGTPDGLKAELQGDAIQVELAPGQHDGEARRALDRVDGLHAITVNGTSLRASARDGGAAIPAVLAALDAHGAQALSVTVARPTLNDVYLRHAGRAFHQAEIEHEEVAA
jgi:ABC-2 type transport system ATP-binding protein